MKVRERLTALFFVLGLMLFVKDAFADTAWLIDPSDVDRVYDGDTFYITLNGLPPVFGDELPIRLAGADTPELRSRCKTEEIKAEERRLARESRDYLNALLLNAQEIRIDDLQRGSFFRVVADVYVDGISVHDLMVSSGHAVAVEDTSADWCEIIVQRWVAN